MTITEARIRSCVPNRSLSGIEASVEIEVDFTGTYDYGAAVLLDEVEITSTSDTWPLVLGSQFSTSLEIYLQSVSPELVAESYANGQGTFVLKLKYAEYAIAPIEDPNNRPDQIVFRREPYSKPIARDRAKRIIGTYSTFTTQVDANTTKTEDKPIEIFANPPVIPTTRLYATITCYRPTYMLANDAYSIDDDDDWIIVNAAQLNLDGIICKAGQVALLSIPNVTRVKINGVPSIQHVMQLGIARRWDLRVVNAGVRAMGTGGKSVPLMLPETNERATSPYPLSAAGQPLPHGFKASDVVYLNFATTKPYDFGKFKFGLNGWSGS